MKVSRLLIATVLALVLAIVFISNVFGQTYSRHALIEENTGTWCRFCAWGGYEMDSIEKWMGENVVAISWHGPKGYGEPLWIPQADTLNSYFTSVSGGYPWAVVGRNSPWGNYASSTGGENKSNPWASTCRTQASQAPLMDFRIVNAVYSSGFVDFDLDVTPFDVSSLPTEDTTSYVVVAVLTENGIVSSQSIEHGSATDQVDDYHHYSVARICGSKVLGDKIVIGTKTPVAWPVRKHYHINAAKSSDWVQDSMEVKAFVARRSAKDANGEIYYDAGRSGYLTALPSTPTPAIAAILPQGGTTVSSKSGSLPIVWSPQGGAGTNAKIEFSIDGGKTWSLITASASATNIPAFQWAIPNELFGQSNVMVKITDVQNSAISSTTPSFSIAAKPYFTINITADNGKPSDTMFVGQGVHINWSAFGGAESVKLEYSTDNSKWTLIKNVSTGTSLAWVVPAGAAGATTFVRVSDNSGAVGITTPSVIMTPGTITNVTLDGGPTFSQGQQVAIHWTPTGYLGHTVRFYVYNPDQMFWFGVGSVVASDQNQATITMPAWNATNAILRVIAEDSVKGESQPFNIGASNGVAIAQTASAVSVSPDPVSVRGTVTFSLAAPANASLVLRDLLGREVLRNNLGMLSAGPQTATFNTDKLSAGTYEYSLELGSEQHSGKIVVVK